MRDKHPAVNTLFFCTFVISFFYSLFLIWQYASPTPPPAPTFPPKCYAFDVFLLALTFNRRCGVCGVWVCRRALRRYLRCAPLSPQVNLMSFHPQMASATLLLSFIHGCLGSASYRSVSPSSFCSGHLPLGKSMRLLCRLTYFMHTNTVCSYTSLMTSCTLQRWTRVAGMMWAAM